MLANTKYIYALDMWTVEKRPTGWYFSRSAYHGDRHEWRGPYSSEFSAARALPRLIEIDGRRYLWRDLVALRRAQATPAEPQPALFPLREDHRPAGGPNADERYREPSLFTVLERSR